MWILLSRAAGLDEGLTGGAISDADLEQLVMESVRFLVTAMFCTVGILVLLYVVRRFFRYSGFGRESFRPMLPEGWALYSDSDVRQHILQYASLLWMEPRLPGLWGLFPWRGREHVLERLMDAPDFVNMLLGAGIAAGTGRVLGPGVTAGRGGSLAVRKDRLDEAAKLLKEYAEQKFVNREGVERRAG